MVFQDEEILKVILRPMTNLRDAVTKEELLSHIQSAPKSTVLRINNRFPANEVKETIEKELEKQYFKKNLPCPNVQIHPLLHDTLVIKNTHESQVNPTYPKVIVGLQCGLAVLRGSHVYAAGLMGVPSGIKPGSKVSVFADIHGLCKRGLNQEFTVGPTAFVGNGTLVQSRVNLFGPGTPSGLAVEMFETKFDCPSMSDVLENTAIQGIRLGFLQNLPSVLCGHVLDPQPGEMILDMCAAPGGKTTHIASLMGGQGTVLALDRSANKIRQIEDNAKMLGLQNIKAFVMDATKACSGSPLNEDDKDKVNEIASAPPFPCQFFDRILLDAPCSGVGQRPQLYNAMKSKEFLSFPKLQRKLFSTAYDLLKDGGQIVYSTCTYSIFENEEIISWAIQKFPKLRIVPCEPRIGKPGFFVEGLTPEKCELMQRFGTPVANQSMWDEASDSIGFFLCCLVKDPGLI